MGARLREIGVEIGSSLGLGSAALHTWAVRQPRAAVSDAGGQQGAAEEGNRPGAQRSAAAGAHGAALAPGITEGKEGRSIKESSPPPARLLGACCELLLLGPTKSLGFLAQLHSCSSKAPGEGLL